MYKFLIFVMAAMIAGLSFTDDAEARRRGGSFGGGSRTNTRTIPVIIPISTGSTSVVFVKELPDMAVFKFEDKGYYDLGYKFGMFGGGEWVGYFKASSGYLELDQTKVREIVLPLVGLTEADAPKRAAGGQMMVGMWWVIAALVGLAFLLLRFPRLLGSVLSMRGKKDEEDGFKMPVYGRHNAAVAGGPAPKPGMLEAAGRATMAAPAYGRAPAGGSFGKRRV